MCSTLQRCKVRLQDAWQMEGGEEGVDRVFYELASDSRLNILRELQSKSYKMQELARKLDLTDTEAFRQLQRLSEAQMIQRQPDGAYAITQYGKLLMQFSRSFEFAYKFKQCLLTRDIWRLPQQFINRLGEFSNVSLNTDSLEMINNIEQLISNSEHHLWIIGEKPLGFIGGKITAQVQKGLTVKLLFGECSSRLFENVTEVKGIFEKRVIPVIPATLVLNEKFAGVNLLSIDGRADNAVFYGNNPAFLTWTTDLFLYYWDQGKRCYST
jgi:predicted transcriptional regulator